VKVGILSDSHGNTENLKQAAKWLVENEKVDVLVHLGDNWDDIKVLEKFKVKLTRVPGVFSSYYKDPKIPNRLIETFNKKKVLISHTEISHKNDLPEDLKPEKIIAKRGVDMAWVGHTHIPKIEERQGVLILNPGHLKSEDKKGYLPSFGLVDFKERIAKVISFKAKVAIIQKTF